MRQRTPWASVAVLSFLVILALTGCGAGNYENFWHVKHPEDIRLHHIQTWNGWSDPADGMVSDIDSTNVKMTRTGLKTPASTRVYSSTNSKTSINGNAYTNPYKNKVTPCARFKWDDKHIWEEPEETGNCTHDDKIEIVKIVLLHNMYYSDPDYIALPSRPNFQRRVLTHEMMHGLGFYTHKPDNSILGVNRSTRSWVLNGQDKLEINKVYPTPYP